MLPAKNKKAQSMIELFADRTGLEPATSAVTGRHSNQLNYRSKTRFFVATNPDVRFAYRDLENLLLLCSNDFLRLNYRSKYPVMK
jgi:hypothetical protein